MSGEHLPRLAIAILGRLVPARGRSEVLGDLAEEYQAVGRRSGPRRAHRWLWGQVASLALAWAAHALGALFRGRTVLWRDTQMASRALARRPLASVGAAAMLAVGLVAVTLSGALRQALLDRPVSAVHGHAVQRVVAVEQAGREQSRFSLPEWRRIGSHVEPAATLSAVGLEPALVGTGPLSHQTLAEIVSDRHVDVIGMALRTGRPLLAQDFVEGAPAVVVISDALWQRLYQGGPNAIGAPIRVNGRPFSVVGIARAGSPTSFWGASVDLWVPLSQGDAFFSPGWRTNATARAVSLFALPDAPAADVADRLARAAADLAAEYPASWQRRSLTLTPATALLGTQRDVARMLSRILLALAVLILAVAAANLGTMMLASAAAGRRALAIHVAIGAGPGAAPRRLLIEGALIGTAASLLAAVLYAAARARVAEVALLPTLSLRLDLPAGLAMLRVLAPAGIVAGLAMAAAPAIWVARQATASSALAGGTRVAASRGIAIVRRIAVASQMALCLVLIVGATLFSRSLEYLAHADLGIGRQGLVAFDFDVEPASTAGGAPEVVAAEALRRVRSMPEVAAAAMANRAPVDASTPLMRVSAPGINQDAGLEVTFNTVTAGYFDTVDIRVVPGRSFREGETSGAVIVNETLARRLWPDADALNRALVLEARGITVTVVGIARDAKYRSIDEGPSPHLYLPAAPAFGQALLVRTRGDARRALTDVQGVLDDVGPGVAGFFPRTLDDHLAIQLLPVRAVSTVSKWLSVLALIFCAVGLYGLMSWFGTLRQQEMAIRLALGASRLDVERLVLGQAFAIAGPGMLAGLLLSAAGVGAARGLLFGLGAVDVAGPAAGVAVMLAVIVGASWRPARAAARTDPAVTLRAS